MYQKILVPLDGSELAECVFPHVEQIAKGCGVGSVVLVRVLDTTAQDSYRAYIGDPLRKELDDNSHKWASEYLDETAAAIDSLKEKDAATADSMATLQDTLENLNSRVGNIGLYANNVYQKVSGATVTINNGTDTAGTGFLYQNGEYIITAYHVIEGMSSIYAIFPDGRSHTIYLQFNG